MKIVILHHPSDAGAALACRAHLALVRAQGHTVEACSTHAFVADPNPATEADIALLILSAEFVAWWVETPSIWRIEARLAGQIPTLLPVRFRACDLTDPLRRVRCVPDLHNLQLPIAEQKHPDEGWTLVARSLRQMLTALEAGPR